MAGFQEYINQIITLHLQLLCQKIQQCRDSHNTIFSSLFSHRLYYNHYQHGLASDSSADQAVLLTLQNYGRIPKLWGYMFETNNIYTSNGRL